MTIHDNLVVRFLIFSTLKFIISCSVCLRQVKIEVLLGPVVPEEVIPGSCNTVKFNTYNNLDCGVVEQVMIY